MDPASVIGIISFGLTVCDGIVQYYSAYKDQDVRILHVITSLESLRKILMSLMTTLQEIGKNPSKHVMESSLNVEKNIKQSEEGLEKLTKKLEKITYCGPSHGVWNRVKEVSHRASYPFHESTLVKLVEVVADLRDNLVVAVLSLGMSVALPDSVSQIVLNQS